MGLNTTWEGRLNPLGYHRRGCPNPLLVGYEFRKWPYPGVYGITDNPTNLVLGHLPDAIAAHESGAGLGKRPCSFFPFSEHRVNLHLLVVLLYSKYSEASCGTVAVFACDQ